jgi:hypothetical protein
MFPTKRLFILVFPYPIFEARLLQSPETPDGRMQRRAGLQLAESMEGGPLGVPFREFRQPEFGGLHQNNNTFCQQNSTADFGRR